MFYVLKCEECAGDPIPFASPEERGRWARQHREATGHDRWWVKDVEER